MSETHANEEKEKSRKAGVNVLVIFLSFFLCVALVNAFFIYKAIGTHSGTVTDSPYEKGLAYNRTIEAARAQAGYAWGADVQMKKLSPLRYDVAVVAATHQGNPVSVDDFEVMVLRPVDARDDLAPVLAEVSDGRYAAIVEFPKPGRWELKARIVRGEETLYLTKPLVIE